MFQHTAARRRLLVQILISQFRIWFQHTAARRRLLGVSNSDGQKLLFQHTAARRRLHSIRFKLLLSSLSFNTQPPEGGCDGLLSLSD